MSPSRLTAVLIGPMGAGKTAVGRELARRLDQPFADLDALTVEAAGKPIPQIFADDGEGAFRDLEARLLAEALRTRDGVLALGGGAPIREESAQLLRPQPVVLLEVDEHIVEARLRRSQDRPLLAGEDPMRQWRLLAEQRRDRYRDVATWTITVGGEPPEAVARRIHQLIRDTPAGSGKGSGKETP